VALTAPEANSARPTLPTIRPERLSINSCPIKAQFCLYTRPLPVKLGIGVGRAAMGLLDRFSSRKSSGRVAAAAYRPAVFSRSIWLETLH
jgi:hypothetical protein